VKLFQESVGALADGMAFPDTFDAIERLRHVWAGKPAAGPHPQGGIGFARAASVLEDAGIAITASDPISRNVAGRIWNLAHATVENCGIELVDAPADASAETRALIVLSSTPLPAGEACRRGQRRARRHRHAPAEAADRHSELLDQSARRPASSCPWARRPSR
jgi:hypothetical protein